MYPLQCHVLVLDQSFPVLSSATSSLDMVLQPGNSAVVFDPLKDSAQVDLDTGDWSQVPQVFLVAAKLPVCKPIIHFTTIF